MAALQYITEVNEGEAPDEDSEEGKRRQSPLKERYWAMVAAFSGSQSVVTYLVFDPDLEHGCAQNVAGVVGLGLDLVVDAYDLSRGPNSKSGLIHQDSHRKTAVALAPFMPVIRLRPYELGLHAMHVLRRKLHGAASEEEGEAEAD